MSSLRALMYLPTISHHYAKQFLPLVTIAHHLTLFQPTSPKKGNDKDACCFVRVSKHERKNLAMNDEHPERQQ